MNEITWTLNLKVKDGPTFAPTNTMKVEAYDKVDIEVGVDKKKTVAIQPGTRGEIEFLMIIRTDPKADPPLEGDVKYKVSGASSAGGGSTTSGSGTSTISTPSTSTYEETSDSGEESARSTGMPATGTKSGGTSSTTDGSGGSGDDWIVLDYVHVVLGKGALKLLKDEPQEITFWNEQQKAAQITVLVGRTATRESAPPSGTEGIRDLRP